eukprot:SAG22_NODE_869_length_6749_cov_3.048120_1_plen_451_part_00
MSGHSLQRHAYAWQLEVEVYVSPAATAASARHGPGARGRAQRDRTGHAGHGRSDMRLLSPLLLLLAAAAAPPPAAATVQLPRWFSDGMVLQSSDERGPPAFLAGRTVPAGEKVSITGDAGEYTVTSEPGTGYWKVTLAGSASWKNSGAGGAGMTITVKGATGPPAVATGVLAGDVFFCAGQSNMLFSLHQAINYTAEAATLASFPNFRFFMANRALNSTAPNFDLTTDDKNCDAAAPPPPPHLALAASASICAAGSFLNNTAFGHGTGPSIRRSPGKDAADCCAQCSSATWAPKGCLFFTWHPAGTAGSAAATCYFKTQSKGPTLPRPGYVLGGTGAPPPPPPPPKPCNQWLTAAAAAENDAKFLLSFSAVCFMTARDIARVHTHDRPMGLVQAAWGGSRIEAWMSSAALKHGEATVLKGSDHCLPLCFSAFPCGSTAFTADRCNQLARP